MYGSGDTLYDLTKEEFLDRATFFFNEMYDDIVEYYTENDLVFDPEKVAQETWDMLRDGSYERP